jgi:hypothetical protein
VETIQTPQNELNLPSGYERVEQLSEKIAVGPDVLHWVNEPQELSVAKCTMSTGQEFYLANAVGTNSKLIEAADSLTEHQQRNVNNMFYSRLPGFMENFYSSGVDTKPSRSTELPLYVTRNKAGQRVYFSTPEVQVEGEPTRIALRLAACDKNKQWQVLKVLDPKGDKNKFSKTR